MTAAPFASLSTGLKIGWTIQLELAVGWSAHEVTGR